MDWLETLLPILIFIVYFLSQLRKSRQPEPPSSGEAAPQKAAEARRSTSFEELMRQIQEAAEADRRASARPAPAPAPPPREPEFRLLGGYEHEEHGFGLDNPFSEEAFERLARGQDITEHPLGHLDAGPHALRRRRSTPGPHPLVSKLRSPGSAREAFALKEILDAPRSKRRHFR